MTTSIHRPSLSMPQFLRIAVPLTAVFLLACTLEYRAGLGAERARLFTQETAAVQRGVRRVERELEVATDDLRFLADLVADAVADTVEDEALAAVGRSALTFVRSQPSYLRVQFIDSTGREVLSVASEPGDAGTAAREALDEEGVANAMRLEPAGVHVSPLGLRVAGGVVQEPHVPVIRLAMPVDDGAGERRGVVVLTVHGDHFLRAFDQSPTSVEHMIVNADGYWLQWRPDVEWGFALEHGRSFRRSYADVWRQMRSLRPRGQVESSEGVFCFDTVTPRPLPAGAADGSREEGFWVLIAMVPPRLLDELAVGVGTPILVRAVPLYCVLLLFTWAVAAALNRRRLSGEALRGLEKVKSTMMTAALDGIVVMDEAGLVLEFNPSAQQIFGYTLAEARGRLVADLIIPPAHREAHRVGLDHYLATGEGPIIDKHIKELTGVRKNGEEFPVELTVCALAVGDKQLFYGFLRDLSDYGRRRDGSAGVPDSRVPTGASDSGDDEHGRQEL